MLFPEGPLPLRIFETRYVDMVRRCMREEQHFGVALIREGSEVGPADTFDVGTMAKIVDFHQLSDGFLGLSCIGEQRFRILSRKPSSGRTERGRHRISGARSQRSALPEQHARLAELLKTVLPQLGEVYAGIEMQLDDAVWVGYRLGGDSADRGGGKAILPGTRRPDPAAGCLKPTGAGRGNLTLDVAGRCAPSERAGGTHWARVSQSAMAMADSPRQQPLAQ